MRPGSPARVPPPALPSPDSAATRIETPARPAPAAVPVDFADAPTAPIADALASLRETPSREAPLVESRPPVEPPPAAAPLSGPRPDHIEVHAEPASLWRRLLAFTVDAAAVLGITAVYLLAAAAVTGIKVPTPQTGGLEALAYRAHALEPVLLPALFLTAVLAMAYAAAFGFLWEGRTLGRRLAGIRLVDTSGLPPRPARAIVRAALSLVSFGIFLGGFWLALFDPRRQTLHDKLTSTFVVKPT